MSGNNAELIAEARVYPNGLDGYDAQRYAGLLLDKLSDALEAAGSERDAALAVIAEIAADLDAETSGLMTHAMNDMQTRLSAIIDKATS